MLVVDTNVLVYAYNAEASEHEGCLEFIQACRHSAEPWHVTWGIIYEFLSVVTNREMFPAAASAATAWQFARGVLESPSLSVLVPTVVHQQALAQVIADLPDLRGRRFHDARIVALMREHGVKRIVTRDGGFRRFAGIEVIDPLD